MSFDTYMLIVAAIAVPVVIWIKWPDIKEAGRPEREARAQAQRHLQQQIAYEKFKGSQNDQDRR